MYPWVSIIRPINALMGFFATFISALVGIGFHITDYLFTVTVAGACVFLVIGSGNVINDISDIESDRTNHPDRPLPSGKIGLKGAWTYSIVLFAAAVILSSLFLPRDSPFVVVIAIAVLISYEMKLKRTGFPGNLAISVLVGMIFVFGGFAVSTFYKMIPLFIMAFATNTAREIVKDIEDLEGDVDRQTLPKRLGIRTAGSIAAGFTLAGVAVSYVPYALNYFGIYYLLAVIIADAVFLISVVAIFSSAKKSQNYSKLGMILGLVAFTIGGIA